MCLGLISLIFRERFLGCDVGGSQIRAHSGLVCTQAFGSSEPCVLVSLGVWFWEVTVGLAGGITSLPVHGEEEKHPCYPKAWGYPRAVGSRGLALMFPISSRWKQPSCKVLALQL